MNIVQTVLINQNKCNEFSYNSVTLKESYKCLHNLYTMSLGQWKNLINSYVKLINVTDPEKRHNSRQNLFDHFRLKCLLVDTTLTIYSISDIFINIPE